MTRKIPTDRHDPDDLPFEVAQGRDGRACATFHYAEDAAAFLSTRMQFTVGPGGTTPTWVIRYRPLQGDVGRKPGALWTVWEEGVDADGLAWDSWDHVAYMAWSRVREWRRAAVVGPMPDDDDEKPSPAAFIPVHLGESVPAGSVGQSWADRNAAQARKQRRTGKQREPEEE